MTAIRLPVSFSLAWLTTAALFWFLGSLIAGGPHGPVVPVVPKIQFTTRHIFNVVPPPPPPIKPPSPKPVLPPNAPALTVAPPPSIVTGPVDSLLPPDFLGPAEGTPGPRPWGNAPPPGGTDRAALPQVRIEPEYPQIAKARGIEGWITFRFTVTREGRVKDVVIVAADPPSVWDAATLRAVSTWKYQPAVEDGVPVEQEGVTATYRFTLDR